MVWIRIILFTMYIKSSHTLFDSPPIPHSIFFFYYGIVIYKVIVEFEAYSVPASVPLPESTSLHHCLWFPLMSLWMAMSSKFGYYWNCISSKFTWRLHWICMKWSLLPDWFFQFIDKGSFHFLRSSVLSYSFHSMSPSFLLLTC